MNLKQYLRITTSHAAMRKALSLGGGVANVDLGDGVSMQLNLDRHLNIQARKSRMAEIERREAERRAQIKQAFNNVVRISEQQIPLQHIHPRTARVARFKQLVAEGNV